MGPYKSSKDYFKIASLSDVMYESEIAEINYLRFKIDTNLTDSVANRRANIFKQQVSNGEDFKSLSEQTANDTNIISGNISDFSRDNNIQLNFSEMALDSIMIAKQGRVLIIDNVYDNDVYVVEVEKVMSQFPTFLIYVDSSRISVSKETDSIVRNKAEDVLSKMSDEENISLRDIAETGDLYYNNISGIDVTTFNLSPVLRDCRDVVNWMFDESRKVGDLSEDYFECDRNRKLLIVRLLSVNDAGDIPLDEVRSEIKEIISANKQYDRLEDLLSNQRSLEGINRIFPETQILERKNLNMSESNLFNGAANSSSLGEMSKPIKGDDALYFISVLDKTPIDNNQYQDIISQQDQDKRLDINDYQQNLFTKSLLQSILIDKSIVDNRHLIED